MKKLPEIIFEVANFHAGSLSKINKAINIFNNLKYKNKSIKFQVFRYSDIANEDYQWFKTYKKLYFEEKTWRKIFSKIRNKKIWIDIFDNYSLEVLEKNFNKIYGIKLQASVVNNFEIFEKLKKLNLKKINIIINLSGFKRNSILTIYKKFLSLNSKDLILQFGFQDYPTKIEDTNIDKINFFKKKVKNFSYADHLDAKDNFSKVFPAILAIKGYNYIEKHFCLNRKKTTYDYYSALEPKEFDEMINNIKNYYNINKEKKFLNIKEKKYLEGTKQKLFLKKKKFKGSSLCLNDFTYKRSNHTGISSDLLNKIINKKLVLKKDIEPNYEIKFSNFKKNKIGIFVVCRLKSSRLKRKALEKISNKPSIFRVIDSCLKIKKADCVFLATSYLKEDYELIKILKQKYKTRIKYIAGDPDDVLKRLLQGAIKEKVDTVVRVTGDCPVISNELIDNMLTDHVCKGADFTYAKRFTLGTVGEIYSVGSLKKILQVFKRANYSEYLPYYYWNNSMHFNLNMYIVNDEFIRPYRLTLDYKEDLDMFNLLFDYLKNKRLKINIKNIIRILDKFTKISAINKRHKLIYKQKKFINFISKKTTF